MTLTIEDIEHLSQEIRHLMQAGLPLESSLASAGMGRSRRLQAFLSALQQRLERGESLPQILESQTSRNARMLTVAIGAGLKSGRPALAIELMGDYAADILELRSGIVRAAAYPMVIVGVASLMLMLVVQHFLTHYYDFAVMQMGVVSDPRLVGLLQWTQQYPAWVFGPPAVLCAVVLFWVLSGRASAMTFRGPEKLLLLLPGLKSIVRDLQCYTLTRMLALLTDNGLTLPESLTLAGVSSGNAVFERTCRGLAAVVSRGGMLATVSAAESAGIPPLLMCCLKQVESQEERMRYRLRSAAQFYRQRFERGMMWMQLAMPMVMFLFLGGGCVLIYSLLVFWPVITLYNSLAVGGIPPLVSGLIL
ncbi:MAG: ral secretion pathway protein [Planctomycetota bacterium]|jgi:type II secretory pathway component PulF